MTTALLGHDDDLLRSRRMDWLSRFIAGATLTVPRFAPSRWRQRANARRANDLRREYFHVATDDGERLEAVYFPASPTPLSLSEGLEKSRAIEGQTRAHDKTLAPTEHALLDTGHSLSAAPCTARLPIVFAHGWTETKEFHHHHARLLTSLGHDVIMFDHRAHGRSTGRFTTFAVHEADDIRVVIDAAAQRGWIGERLLTMGVSMGGAAVLRHAARDDRVAGVVAFAPFTSFLDAVQTQCRRHFWFLSDRWACRGYVQACARRGFDIRQSTPIHDIGQIDAPVLIIVGQRDSMLPGEDHARRLHEAVGGDRGRLVEVPHANHVNICMGAWPEADDALKEFCEQVGRADAATARFDVEELNAHPRRTP